MNKNSELYNQFGVPSILTSNTYFWKPNRMANGRRNTEKKVVETVKAWLSGLGFEIITVSENSVLARKGNIEARFEYFETCQHVYKHFSAKVNGKKVLLPTMLKLCAVE